MADVTYVLLSNAFVSPLISYFNPMVCYHKYRMKKAKNSNFISQSDANALFENPPVDMAKNYANTVKTLLLTVVFTPLLPTALFISLAGLVIDYWVSKYLLLRRHSWPKRLSGELPRVMIHFIPLAVLLYSIMNYICMRYLNPDESAAALA